jgi:hypothetical protein
MVAGPLPADHTDVGGEPGSFNTDEPEMQPVEQNSPTKVHVPGWREIILGGSGGIEIRDL